MSSVARASSPWFHGHLAHDFHDGCPCHVQYTRMLMTDERRIFSEQEVGAVMRRAVEMQEHAQDAGSYTPGVTQEELKRIGAEVGVDPKYLDLAIREAMAPESRKGPLNLTEQFQRVVEGELSPDDFDIVLEELKQFGRRHPITQVGRTLQGKVWTGCSLANLQMTSRNGRTKVDVRSNAIFPFLMTFYPAFLVALAGVGALSAAGLAWAGILGAIGLFTAATFGFRALLRKGHAAARALADRLERKISEATSPLRANLAASIAPETQMVVEVQQST